MRLLVFFGHHKVGSSALQAFFANNYQALLAEGILYPATESEGLAYRQAEALGRLHGAEEPSMNIREPHNALAFKLLATATGGRAPEWHPGLPPATQMIRAIRMQVKYLQPRTVVLSSEVMSNFGAHHPELVDMVAGIFPEAKTELFCALRRPDQYLASWHAQRLRFGAKIGPLSANAALNYIETIHFDYEKMLRPWVERMPGARLHLRNYADILKSGGTAQDFIRQTRLALPKRLAPEERRNQSMPFGGIEVARLANRDLNPESAQEVRLLILQAGRKRRLTPNHDIELFGEEVRAELARRFEPIHAYISEQAGKPAFFPDIDEMRRVRPVSEREANIELMENLDPDAVYDLDAREFLLRMRRVMTGRQ